MATNILQPRPGAGPPARLWKGAADGLESLADTGAARGDTPTVALARSIYHLRRRRGELFGHGLFSEPGWDILLDLYVAEHDGRRISTCSACIGAAAPQTTGLRWLGQLEAQGMVLKDADPFDARRMYIRLTAEAIARMDELLNDAVALFKASPICGA